MKLIDALKNVDRSPQNKAWVDLDILTSAIHIEGFYDMPREFEERVQSYWLIKWLCTDTWVGLQAIYFDGELIGATWQASRKGDQTIKFTCADCARKLRDYILGAAIEFPLIDPSEEIDNTYGVEYGSQLLVDTGLYNNQPVRIVRESIVRNYNTPVEEWSKIVVRNAQNEEFKIDLVDFEIPLHVKDEKILKS